MVAFTENTYLYTTDQIRGVMVDHLTAALQGDAAQANKQYAEAAHIADVLSLAEASGCIIQHDQPFIMPALWWLQSYAGLGRKDVPLVLRDDITTYIDQDPSLKLLTEKIAESHATRRQAMENGKDPVGDAIIAQQQKKVLQAKTAQKSKVTMRRR